MRFTIIILLLLFCFVGFSNKRDSILQADKRANTPVPYTLADRDRLLKVESEITSIRRVIDLRFDAVDKRIGTLETLIFFILGGMFSLFGFIIWDRYTIMRPIMKDIEKLKSTQNSLLERFNKLAKLTADKLPKISDKAAMF